MIDRFGKTVNVGWAPHELLWLDAALSLSKIMRAEAYQDIADMSGRSFRAVQAKALKVASQKRLDLALAMSTPCPIMVPVRRAA